ncbi:helix-turn-helix domain-containing protein [Trebonia sp.]|uniref:helix-turn-helix domain-containing protein n=1 Tax=Trebonia sp. TaxID=2767075 RepID=UPI00345C08E9
MKTYRAEEVRALADYQVLSVHEAADILGISMQRVRQMIHGGQLAARRSSAGWLIPAAEVAERSERLHRGRPPEPHTAWSVLALLAAACTCVSEDDQPGCIESAAQVVPDRKQRHRVLRMLASLPDPVADQTPWRRLLSARGKVHYLWVHPGVLDRLAADPRVSKGGAEAMVGDHDGLTRPGARLELYVHEADADKLIRGYHMQEDRNGQVYLIIVPSSVPPELAPDRGRPVPAPAAASDLLEEKDPRARYAGAIELRSCLDALHNIGWLDHIDSGTTQRGD